MKKYPFPKDVDKTSFKKDIPDEALYGLPLDVKFCKSCGISNQRPSSTPEFKNSGDIAKQTIKKS